MKTILLALVALVPALGFSQAYSVNWSVVAGGGGTSTSGVFAVSGTIGQPDAGTLMSGGGYAVAGGFWGQVSAVQTPGAPTLTITYSGNQAVISWPAAVSGWTLQTNTSLVSGSWGDYLGTVVNNSVTNFPPKGNLFFRLKQ